MRTPGTEQLAEQLKLYLGNHDGFLLENHGALTVGSDLREAALRMELVEHNAQITMFVRQIGKPLALGRGRWSHLWRSATELTRAKISWTDFGRFTVDH